MLTFVQGRSSRLSTNTSSPHFTSWFLQAKKWRKLAYDPDQEISLVEAVLKQRTNLWKYDKLICWHFSCTRAKMAETNYTRKDHREVAGKWGVWGGKGYENFFWKLLLKHHKNKFLQLPFYLLAPKDKKKRQLPVLKLASTLGEERMFDWRIMIVGLFLWKE